MDILHICRNKVELSVQKSILITQLDIKKNKLFGNSELRPMPIGKEKEFVIILSDISASCKKKMH